MLAELGPLCIALFDIDVDSVDTVLLRVSIGTVQPSYT